MMKAIKAEMCNKKCNEMKADNLYTAGCKKKGNFYSLCIGTVTFPILNLLMSFKIKTKAYF